MTYHSERFHAIYSEVMPKDESLPCEAMPCFIFIMLNDLIKDLYALDNVDFIAKVRDWFAKYHNFGHTPRACVRTDAYNIKQFILSWCSKITNYADKICDIIDLVNMPLAVADKPVMAARVSAVTKETRPKAVSGAIRKRHCTRSAKRIDNLIRNLILAGKVTSEIVEKSRMSIEYIEKQRDELQAKKMIFGDDDSTEDYEDDPILFKDI